MSFTLAGSPLTSATVRIPRYGVGTATCAVAGSLALTAGQRTTLTIGDLSLTCSVLPDASNGATVPAGGAFGGQTTYTLALGAARWGAVVPARAHRSDQGITVAEVARDLAQDAGEIGVVLEPGAERPLGYAWLRRAGVAADALTALVGEQWWPAADGITHLGARPLRPISPATLHGLDYVPALRRATASLSDDAVAQFLPGAVLSHASLPDPLEVGYTVIRVEADAVEVDLYGERPPQEMLGAILRELAARARMSAPMLYEVTEDANGRTSGRPAGPAATSLDALPWLDRAFGLPGARADLATGMLVGVVLLDGSPGAPRVAAYLPGTLPLTVGLDATTAIELGAHGSVAALAKAPEANLNFAALRAAIVALGGSPPAMLDVSCSKAKGQ